MNPRQLYESELGQIQRVIDWVCRRHAQRPEEAEDFSSWVHVRLLENDCAILGKFQGKSKLSTYLTTVVNNLYKDHRIAQDVKWRPSAIAKRLGWIAVALETEISWHGHSRADAAEFVRQQPGVKMSVEELEVLASKLPTRYRRTFSDDSKIDTVAHGNDSDEPAQRNRARPGAERIARCLSEALQELAPQDRLILKMRFQEGLKVVTIARVLELEPGPLYRRIDRLLLGVRRALEQHDLAWEDVREILGWDFDLDVDY